MKLFPPCTLIIWLALSLCPFLGGCKRTTSPAPQSSDLPEARVQPQDLWRPIRPTWLQLPAEASPEQLHFYAALTDSLEQVDVPIPQGEPLLPARLRAAAQLVNTSLPPTLWRADIQQTARELAEGRMRTIQVAHIEPSRELSYNVRFYVEYDSVQDRLVYGDLSLMQDIELRTALVYALAERIHLRHLADMANVSPRVLALTQRMCTNLLSEFKVMTHLVASEAQADWIEVDPDFQLAARTPNEAGVLIAPTDLSVPFGVVYPSVELLIGRQHPDRKRLELLRHAREIGISQYPSDMGRMCPRYIISRGPRQGQYLVPSDVVPEIVAVLNRLPEINPGL
ncbi:hypothetical protein KBD34_04040 [Patescibacteria group bacterium]|nr:hypothetical protein [Patescibacteria group bacterium]